MGAFFCYGQQGKALITRRKISNANFWALLKYLINLSLASKSIMQQYFTHYQIMINSLLKIVLCNTQYYTI